MDIKYPERPAIHAIWAAGILVALVLAMIVMSSVSDRSSEPDAPATATAPVE